MKAKPSHDPSMRRLIWATLVAIVLLIVALGFIDHAQAAARVTF